MGNQREIRQVEPRQGLGVIIRIRAGCTEQRLARVRAEGYRFYTGVCFQGEAVRFPNLDGDDIDLGALPGDHLIIQSGGKMWCGYENFIDHIREWAAELENALFYVGDEEDYIDEFRIRDGELHYRRVHQGYWLPIEEFLADRVSSDNTAAEM